jgi:hypothetical protein
VRHWIWFCVQVSLQLPASFPNGTLHAVSGPQACPALPPTPFVQEP